MVDELGYAEGFPGWRESHGYKAGLGLGGPLGLIVTCPGGQYRSELQSPWDAMEGDDHWYGVTLQLPEGFAGGASDWCVLVQAHEDGVAKPPPWSIVAKTTGLRLEMRHKSGAREILELGPLPVNAPARIAVHCRSTLSIGGLIAVYRDGEPVGVVSGSNRYTVRFPVRPRVGVYRGHTIGLQTAWFGPLRRGLSLQDVSPRDCSAFERAVADAAKLCEERARLLAEARELLLAAETDLHLCRTG